MKKIYTLIITSLLFPLISIAQTTDLPDSETGLSANELKDMRRSNIESKEKIPSVQKLRISETNDPLIRQILQHEPKSTTGVVWKTNYIMSPPAPIREEGCDEDE